MLKDNHVYVGQILERALRIVSYLEGLNESSFLEDQKTQSAVIREFEVIGEATKRISEEFKTQYPNIPWKVMAKMRDVLIHDYEGVNHFRLWDTAKHDIPDLIIEVKKITRS